MSSLKFGDRFEVVASPKNILLLQDMLEDWMLELAEKGNIDLSRESLYMAQRIIAALAGKGEGDRNVETL